MGLRDWTGRTTEGLEPTNVICAMVDASEGEPPELVMREVVRRALDYNASRNEIAILDGEETAGLARVENIEVRIGIGERVVAAGDESLEVGHARPVIECDWVNVRIETSDGTCHELSSDFAVARPHEHRLNDAGLVVTGKHRLDTGMLSAMIRRMFEDEYVRAVRDVGFETEIEYDFATEAMAVAARALLGAEQASEEAVRIAIERHVLGYAGAGSSYAVTIDAGEVEVRLVDPATAGAAR